MSAGLFVNGRLGSLATGVPSGREGGEDAIDLVDVELLWVEVAAAPFRQFFVALVLWIGDGLQEFAVAPWAANVLGRAAPGASTRRG